MKQIKVIGAVGNNPRKDRDGFRVLHRGAKLRTTISYKCRATFGSEEV